MKVTVNKDLRHISWGDEVIAKEGQEIDIANWTDELYKIISPEKLNGILIHKKYLNLKIEVISK